MYLAEERPAKLARELSSFLKDTSPQGPDVRSPAWMVAYAVTLMLLGATYAALVFLGSRAALVFALMALVAVVTAVILTLKR